MDRTKLKQQLASLHRMDLQSLLAEMVDEMAECGDQKLAVSFNDDGKPVAGVVLLAAPDISPYLEALEGAESVQSQGAVQVPEATEEMLVAGLKVIDPLGQLVDWDSSNNDCFDRGQLREIYDAMRAAAPSIEEKLVAEVTEDMTLAGAREWDRQHKLGVRNWLEMMEKIYVAMEAARKPEVRSHG